MRITRLASTAAVVGALLSTTVAVPAHAAVSCRVAAPTHLDGGRVVLRITSSQPAKANVHTFVVVVDTDFGPVAQTWSWKAPNLAVRLSSPLLRVDGRQGGVGCRRWTA